jgi:hypothetical protein
VAYQDACSAYRNAMGLTGPSIELESWRIPDTCAKKGYEEVAKDDLRPVVEYAVLESRWNVQHGVLS